MRIAVIGAGAMGSIYGGNLSQKNDVILIDTYAPVIEKINKDGLMINQNGEDVVFHPKAMVSAEGVEPAELIILFVKALYSKAALASNKALIGPNTYVLTLQNGSGHEDILADYVDVNHVVIGTTEDNGRRLGDGYIGRGGVGNTNVGMLVEDKEGFLPKLKAAFDCSGFNVKIHENIQQLIWDKLFTNVSLSAVTGILQCKMGYIAGNEYAWYMTKRLIHEAVEVAHGMGLVADEEEITAKVKKTSEGSPEGVTSICADLAAGRKTEVETISGSVVRAGAKCGVPAPTHEFVVAMVHAMEGKAN